jgi:cytochrome c-type biogenesis protein CcmH
MRRGLRWAPWILLAVVAAIVLAVGSQRSSHPTLDQQATHIAGEVRCPVCEGQSVAQSQVPASVQIRQQIHQELSSGESSGQILAGLVAAYGPGILEKPPASGVSLVVWVVPVIATVAALGGLALAFNRWRPRRAVSVSEADEALVARELRARPAGPADDDGAIGPEAHDA